MSEDYALPNGTAGGPGIRPGAPGPRFRYPPGGSAPFEAVRTQISAPPYLYDPDPAATEESK